MKGLNPGMIGTMPTSARFSVLRPITCSMSNVSRISRRRWCSLCSGSPQFAQIFLQHLNLVPGPVPGAIVFRRRWCIEGHVAMALQDPGRWTSHSDGHVVILAVVRVSARVQMKLYLSVGTILCASGILNLKNQIRGNSINFAIYHSHK